MGETLEELHLEQAVDNYIKALAWSDETPEWARTLVVGNIRGAISALVDRGVLRITSTSTKPLGRLKT